MISILVGSWLVLMAVGIPIVFSLLIACTAYILYTGGDWAMLSNVPRRLCSVLASVPFLAIPFFILAGNLMNTSGITNRLIRFADALVGRFRGGLAHVDVLTNVIMAGMSGSGMADAAATGSVLIPAMKNEGYPPEFAAAVTGSAATIGPIIPPSIPMIVYGVVASQSVGALFLGGIIPGLMMGLFLMILIGYFSIKRKYPKHAPASPKQIGQAFLGALLPLLFPIIILGGIISGIFTATESAAVASLYALILGMFVYRTLSVRVFLLMLRDTVEITAPLMLIIAAAGVFAYLLTLAQIPQMAAVFILSWSKDPKVILLLINLVLLVMGCFLDAIAIILIVTPVILPILQEVGIDLIHFGVVMVLNVMIGAMTPPFGLYLFLLTKISGRPFHTVVIASAPFLIPLIIILFLITYIPALVMYIPNLVFGKG